jgi:hypothetical protein
MPIGEGLRHSVNVLRSRLAVDAAEVHSAEMCGRGDATMAPRGLRDPSKSLAMSLKAIPAMSPFHVPRTDGPHTPQPTFC